MSECVTCIVTTVRDDVGANAGDARLVTCAAAARVSIGPLDEPLIAAIIARVACDSGAAPDGDTIARVVAACAGRPYLVEVAGRALAGHIDISAATAAPTMSALVTAAPAATSPASHYLLALLLAQDGWQGATSPPWSACR